MIRFHEKKLKKMEEKKANALEMAAQEAERREKKKKNAPPESAVILIPTIFLTIAIFIRDLACLTMSIYLMQNGGNFNYLDREIQAFKI